MTDDKEKVSHSMKWIGEGLHFYRGANIHRYYDSDGAVVGH